MLSLSSCAGVMGLVVVMTVGLSTVQNDPPVFWPPVTKIVAMLLFRLAVKFPPQNGGGIIRFTPGESNAEALFAKPKDVVVNDMKLIAIFRALNMLLTFVEVD